MVRTLAEEQTIGRPLSRNPFSSAIGDLKISCFLSPAVSWRALNAALLVTGHFCETEDLDGALSGGVRCTCTCAIVGTQDGRRLGDGILNLII